jgi:hypothetical protein
MKQPVPRMWCSRFRNIPLLVQRHLAALIRTL